MVKQRGLGQSNHELTKKGDEHKKRKAVTKSGAAQQAQRSASLLASVTWFC